MTKQEHNLDRILQSYLPDEYYEELRHKLIPLLIEWKRRPVNKKIIEPHECNYQEGIDGKIRCPICKETIGQWLMKEQKKKK